MQRIRTVRPALTFCPTLTWTDSTSRLGTISSPLEPKRIMPILAPRSITCSGFRSVTILRATSPAICRKTILGFSGFRSVSRVMVVDSLLSQASGLLTSSRVPSRWVISRIFPSAGLRLTCTSKMLMKTPTCTASHPRMQSLPMCVMSVTRPSATATRFSAPWGLSRLGSRKNHSTQPQISRGIRLSGQISQNVSMHSPSSTTEQVAQTGVPYGVSRIIRDRLAFRIILAGSLSRGNDVCLDASAQEGEMGRMMK